MFDQTKNLRAKYQLMWYFAGDLLSQYVTTPILSLFGRCLRNPANPERVYYL